MSRAEAKKAWITFMAAALAAGKGPLGARDYADMSLALLRERFPDQPPSWQDQQG